VFIDGSAGALEAADILDKQAATQTTLLSNGTATLLRTTDVTRTASLYS